MSTISILQFNDNDKALFKEIAKEIFENVYGSDVTKLENNLEFQNILAQVGLAIHNGRGDVIEDIIYASDKDLKRVRKEEEMKQVRHAFEERIPKQFIEAACGYEGADERKLFLLRLGYKNKYEDLSEFVSRSLPEFEAIYKAFEEGETKESIKEKIENNTLLKANEQNQSLDDLTDEYGLIDDDVDFNIGDIEDFIV